MHSARVAAALRVCRAAPRRLLSVRFTRTQSAELQHQDGSSHTRHGVPGRLPDSRRLDPAVVPSANALASSRWSLWLGGSVSMWNKIWLTESLPTHPSPPVPRTEAPQAVTAPQENQLPGKSGLVQMRRSSICAVISYWLVSLSARTRASNRGVGAILSVYAGLLPKCCFTFALLLFVGRWAQVLIAEARWNEQQAAIIDVMLSSPSWGKFALPHGATPTISLNYQKD